jgi:hypothetical protein
MNLPRTKLHETLSVFEGDWTGVGRVLPTPFGPSGPTVGTWRFAFDPGGYNLIHDYREERAGGHVFTGHGVLTIDPAASEIVWFWFDSYGFPPIPHARGHWDGPRLVLEKSTARGLGRSILSVEGDTLAYRNAVKLADAADFAGVAEGEYRRTAKGTGL